MENYNNSEKPAKESTLIEVLAEETLELDELVFGRCRPQIC